MSSLDLLAFVYLPLFVGAAAWAYAWWITNYLK
jgi:hypothetical protein